MRSESESAGYRPAHLEELVLEELRALLRDDLSDPALFAVTITATVLSVDYRHARVHFALFGPSKEAKNQRLWVARALTRATPFFRAQLASALDLKRVPDLRFVFDGISSVPDEQEEPCE